MHRHTAVKVLAVVLVCWLMVNLVLFGIGRITPLVFWITLAVFALVAYKGMPILRKV